MSLDSTRTWRKDANAGFSIIELLIVIAIIMILSSMAIGVYKGQMEKARIAATKVEIAAFSQAIATYFIDVGQYPISSSGSVLAPGVPDPVAPFVGNGYLSVSLMQSLNGFPYNPLDPRWKGPYEEFDDDRKGTLSGAPLTGATALPQIQIIDAWGTPYYYCRSGVWNPITRAPTDYPTFGGTQLPAGHPLAANETYFNPSTFQIICFGPNRRSLIHPQLGLDVDDIPNF